MKFGGASIARAARAIAAASIIAHSAAADGGVVRSEPALAPLPDVPRIELAAPTPEDVATLDRLLERITAADGETRDTATREILEMPASIVPAVDRRMNALAEAADRNAMKRELEHARDAARAEERAAMKASGKRGKVVTPDYLAVLTAHARPDSEGWQAVTRAVAMSRVLAHVGTVAAVRELIDVHVRFGEMLRVDTQLQVEKLGDRAIAALVEAKRHQAAKIASWAGRQLDALGKAIPGEAVQTPDNDILADVLRAYGRVKDPDAARVVISFANSERTQIRDAARQGVALFGEVANWQLRDTYENIVGKKPPRDWSWDRTARELFGEYDRLRLSDVYRHFDEGKTAHEQGDLPAMKSAWDRVLARSPMFDRGYEMAEGYVEYARKVIDDDRPAALDALRRAERVAKDDAARRPAQSLRLTLEAEDLVLRGVADRELLRRAIDLDDGNDRAKTLLARLQRGEVQQQTAFNRWVAAGAIGLCALVAIAFVAVRRWLAGRVTRDSA